MFMATHACKNSPAGPRFIMLGGFLGAGKTTALLRLAHHLQKAGRRVGIITNDQAAGLVDTALMEELKKGSLIVNLRAEGAPELLAAAVKAALKKNPRGLSVELTQAESFRPGQPTPTHRVAAV